MRKIIIILSIILTFAINLVAYSADNRGLAVNIKQLDSTNVVGKQWVVLIAINKYKNLNPLINPVKDAKEIRDILKSKYYVDNVIELYDNNASKRGIISLFNKLQRDVKTHDSLMIFYAGHGYLDKNSSTGFWMPYDAGKDKIEQDNWLTNQQIRGYLSNIESRHILLVSDSCFSGDILNPNRSIDAPTINNQYFSNAYNKVSRQVLTSGASETVPDESSFAMQFKLELKGNTNAYLDPLTMFNQIRSGVSGTTPMFGDLKNTGHQDGASFLLFLRDKEIKIQTYKKTVSKTPVKVVSKKVESKKMLLTIEKSYGTLKVSTKTLGDLYINNQKVTRIASGDTATLSNIETGTHAVEIKYKNYNEKQEIEIKKNETKIVNFNWEIPNRMVLVEGGTFIMGDTLGDGLKFEKPLHKVTLTYNFYMSKYEVTQKEYKSLIGTNKSNFLGDNLPVESLTWFDAIKYCNALSKKESLAVAYNEITGDLLDLNGNVTTDITQVKGYRLPTEAEWEYVAKGSNKSQGYKYSGSNNIDEVAWYKESKRTHEVGIKTANELGLYDMSGNVWEWCTDWYIDYTSSSLTNPYIYQKASNRVVRGGSWNYDMSEGRVSNRGADAPSYSYSGLGFRVARTK